jgi:hypothetical protein
MTIAGLVISFAAMATANIGLSRARRWNTGTIADPRDLSGMNHMLYLRSFRDDGPLNRSFRSIPPGSPHTVSSSSRCQRRRSSSSH